VKSPSPTAAATPPPEATLPAAAALRLDALCDRIEADWHDGRRPHLEGLLAEFGPAERPVALRELLRLEVALRVAAGERPEPAEYAARFPEASAAVASAFATGPGPPGPAETLAAGANPAAGAGLPEADAPPGYELLGLLGRGGMGVVYHARQLRLRREVALKMVLPGPHASAQALARLLAEAEAIARLDHPNIVRVYELGDHAGAPYFAMEYHPGGSLARRLDGTPRPVPEAARLLEAVARGVSEAHRGGLIHRDLKPANILIGRDGSPRVADFGLVKSLESDSGLTRTDWVMGTPSYMAPEQAAGGARAVGPAADVFSLGSILYELLTGRPPFRGASVVETLDLVRNADPVPPRRLVPGLPRDAETVALKCLEKDPERRYASADALAEDLRRLAAGEPVKARPVSTTEHAWRWCRRRPGVAALVAALAATLVGGLAIVSTLYLDALRSRDLSRRRLDLAESSYAKAGDAIREYMIRLTNEDLLDQPGLETLRRDLFGRARDAYVRLVNGYRTYEAEAGRPAAVEYNLGRAHLWLSEVEGRLGDTAASLAAARQARDTLERVRASRPGEPDLITALVDAHVRIGLLEKDPAASRAAMDRAIAVARDALARQPGEAQLRSALAKALSYGGEFQAVDAGEPGPGGRKLEEARRLLVELVRERPDSEADREHYADTLAHIGRVRFSTGDLDGAEAARREALAIREDLLERHPKAVQKRMALAVDLTNYTAELVGKRRYDAALDFGRRAIRAYEALADEYPQIVKLRLDLAAALSNVAEVYRMLGRYLECEAAMGRSLAEQRRLLARQPDDPFLNLLHGATLGNHGELLLTNLGRPAAALESFDRAGLALGAVLARNPKQLNARQFLRNGLSGKAEAHEALGQLDRALEARDRALALADRPETADAMRRNRAMTVAVMGDHAAAARVAEELAGSPGGPPSAPLDTSRILARAAVAARADAALDPDARPRQAQAYLDRAADVLTRAHRAGKLNDRRHLRRTLARPEAADLRRHPAVAAILDSGFPADPFAGGLR
jgi:serine/threonine protein kinase